MYTCPPPPNHELPCPPNARPHTDTPHSHTPAGAPRERPHRRRRTCYLHQWDSPLPPQDLASLGSRPDAEVPCPMCVCVCVSVVCLCVRCVCVFVCVCPLCVCALCVRESVVCVSVVCAIANVCANANACAGLPRWGIHVRVHAHLRRTWSPTNASARL